MANDTMLNRLWRMYVLVSAVLLLLVVGALIDIITKQDSQVKHLPKIVWILVVVILPLIGSILWFLIGREYSAPVDHGTFGGPRRRHAGATGQMALASAAKTTEEQLAELEREIKFHKEQALIRRLEAEMNDRRKHPE